ncbi:MAG TPA: HEAT repeat domain-containing protein [Polyangiaceae bacterium]|nr:HEAT repeat domain-containing protein [Polyangiaceae bacterium]
MVLALGVATPAHAFVWPNAAERIERQLSSGVVSERQAAAAQLGDLPPAVVRRLVPRALKDRSTDVRLAALEVALRLRLRGVSELVIPWLNHPERRIRMAAIELLRVSPNAQASGPLGRTLSDPDPTLRQSAAEALGASKAADATMQLLSHLDDPMPHVREAIARALAQLGDARAVVPLIAKVQDSHAGVRAAVAQALGELGDARASAALVLALADNDEEVRALAARALGRLRQDAATLSLVALVEQDQNADVRIQAIGALGQVGSDAAIAALIEYLGNDAASGRDARLREASVAALAGLGNKALARVTLCVQNEVSPIRANGCAEVLGRLGGKGTVPALTTALRAGRVDRVVALRALGAVGDPSGLPATLEYLTAPDAAVRLAAIEACQALLATGTPEGRAVEPIVAALNAPEILPSERVGLATILGLTRSARAAPTLMAIAKDADDVSLKRVALEALGLLGPAGQHQVLFAALDDEEPTIRFAAALSLRESANASTAAELLRRLRRAAEQDRQALLLALTGALEKNRDPAITRAVRDLAMASRGGARDALLEAVGNATTDNTSAVLIEWLSEPADVADRAKIAEALAAQPKGVGALERLARDVDGSVRANAVWALASSASAREVPVVTKLTSDRDVAVAGNAVAALGRIAARLGVDLTRELCAALADERSYVRANALAALRLAKKRCTEPDVRELLRTDPSRVVRERAAALLVNVPSADAVLDAQALRRCVLEEPVGSVAASCKEPARALPAKQVEVTVLVVPSGESAPVPRAPFALRLPDGLLRLGVSDRRGAVYEHAAPVGDLSLITPAQLAE